jgi:hypothetical protein
LDGHRSAAYAIVVVVVVVLAMVVVVVGGGKGVVAGCDVVGAGRGVTDVDVTDVVRGGWVALTMVEEVVAVGDADWSVASGGTSVVSVGSEGVVSGDWDIGVVVALSPPTTAAGRDESSDRNRLNTTMMDVNTAMMKVDVRTLGTLIRRSPCVCLAKVPPLSFEQRRLRAYAFSFRTRIR